MITAGYPYSIEALGIAQGAPRAHARLTYCLDSADTKFQETGVDRHTTDRLALHDTTVQELSATLARFAAFTDAWSRGGDLSRRTWPPSKRVGEPPRHDIEELHAGHYYVSATGRHRPDASRGGRVGYHRTVLFEGGGGYPRS